MATDIASLAIKLTGDATSFESSLISAEKRAMAFCSGTGSQFASFAANAGKVFSTLMANPIFAGIAIGAGIFAAYEALDKMSREGEKAAAVQNLLERKLGVTAEAAGGLAYSFQRFHIDNDSASRALAAFNVHLGKAALEGGAAAAAYSRLGLDAAALTELPLDQALGQIGDALAHVENRAERASLQQQVLTRRGIELLPVLAQGTAGMARMAAESQRLGLTFTAADSAMIRAQTLAEARADQAMKSIGRGIANALAVSDAPLRTFIADLKTGLVEAEQGPLAKFRDSLMWMGRVGWPAAIRGAREGFEATHNFLSIPTQGFQRASQLLTPEGDQAGADKSTALGRVGGAIGGLTMGLLEAAAATLEFGYKLYTAGFHLDQFGENAAERRALDAESTAAEAASGETARRASRQGERDRALALGGVELGAAVARTQQGDASDADAAMILASKFQMAHAGEIAAGATDAAGAPSDKLADANAAGSAAAQDAISAAIVQATGGDVQEQIRDGLMEQGRIQAETLVYIREMRDQAVNGDQANQGQGVFGQG
jgi:hypothetical protein